MSSSWLRWRVPLGFLFAFFYIYLAHPRIELLLVFSFPLVVLGCALRSWAAGYLFKGKRVAVGGPYAYVRNPLYVGSFLIGLGFCIALWRSAVPVGTWVLWSAYLFGFLGVYRAKALAEEKELVSSLGDAYVSYRALVPPFFPSRGRVSGLGVQRFSRELYRRNREYQCILGSIGVGFILVLKSVYGF